MAHKLVKKIIFTGKIILKTGLHIGGTNAALNIGGPDKFVVRNPINNIPYIPGSSLKGKLRSLIEIKNGCSKVSTDPNSESGKLFGVAGGNDNTSPSRLIVSDAELDISKPKIDLPYTESKTEVNIDRVTSKANPRTFERVPAGAEFKLSMVLNIFDDENEEELKSILYKAIEMLHDDYLGGQGSRGYGQVEIILDNKNGESKIY